MWDPSFWSLQPQKIDPVMMNYGTNHPTFKRLDVCLQIVNKIYIYNYFSVLSSKDRKDRCYIIWSNPYFIDKKKFCSSLFLYFSDILRFYSVLPFWLAGFWIRVQKLYQKAFSLKPAMYLETYHQSHMIHISMDWVLLSQRSVLIVVKYSSTSMAQTARTPTLCQ